MSVKTTTTVDKANDVLKTEVLFKGDYGAAQLRSVIPLPKIREILHDKVATQLEEKVGKPVKRDAVTGLCAGMPPRFASRLEGLVERTAGLASVNVLTQALRAPVIDLPEAEGPSLTDKLATGVRRKKRVAMFVALASSGSLAAYGGWTGLRAKLRAKRTEKEAALVAKGVPKKKAHAQVEAEGKEEDEDLQKAADLVERGTEDPENVEGFSFRHLLMPHTIVTDRFRRKKSSDQLIAEANARQAVAEAQAAAKAAEQARDAPPDSGQPADGGGPPADGGGPPDPNAPGGGPQDAAQGYENNISGFRWPWEKAVPMDPTVQKAVKAKKILSHNIKLARGGDQAALQKLSNFLKRCDNPVVAGWIARSLKSSGPSMSGASSLATQAATSAVPGGGATIAVAKMANRKNPKLSASATRLAKARGGDAKSKKEIATVKKLAAQPGNPNAKAELARLRKANAMALNMERPKSLFSYGIV